MKLRKLVAQYIVLILLAGCGVTDGSKGLVHQTSGAGAILERHADPEVAATGKDIRENMEAVGAEIGPPKHPLPYSREASAAFRNQQAAEIAARKAWSDLFDWAAGAAAGVFGLGGVWVWIKKLNLGKGLRSVVGVLDGLPPEIGVTVKNAMMKGTLKDGVGDVVGAVVKSLKK